MSPCRNLGDEAPGRLRATRRPLDVADGRAALMDHVLSLRVHISFLYRGESSPAAALHLSAGEHTTELSWKEHQECTAPAHTRGPEAGSRYSSPTAHIYARDWTVQLDCAFLNI